MQVDANTNKGSSRHTVAETEVNHITILSQSLCLGTAASGDPVARCSCWQPHRIYTDYWATAGRPLRRAKMAAPLPRAAKPGEILTSGVYWQYKCLHTNMAEHIFGSTRRHLRSNQKFSTCTFADITQHYVHDCFIANLHTQMLFGFLEMPLTNLDICLSAVLS